MVLTPLLLARWYSVREAAVTGREIASGAAETLTRVADRELIQTVDLYGEALADAAVLSETSLKVLAHEAEDLLDEASKPGGHVFFAEDFDSGKAIPGLTILHIGSAQENGPDAPENVSISFETPSFRLAPGSAPKDDAHGAGVRSEEIRRLGPLGSLLKILFQGAQDRILWAYVSLADGVHLTYPGHGGYPADYDPRLRSWYIDAVGLDGLTWRVMVEAVTRRVVANLSIPLRAPDGRIIGAAGIDAPIAALLPDNDLTLRWSRDMRAILAKVDAPKGSKPSLIVIAGHDSESGGDWREPVAAERIISEDPAVMDRMLADIGQGRSGVVRMPYKGKQSSWAYRPMGRGDGVLLLIVPHTAVTAEATDTEASILNRTSEMISVTGLFTLGAAILVIIMAFAGSRAVTRPLRRLAEAAGRVAGGDLEARVPVSGRDELADLGRAFNDMVPHLAERLRLKNDLDLAMEVQQHLLSRRPPVAPGLDIAGATFFCDETGGDYFDYLAFSGNDGCPLDVIVGDVTGHGISAALFMATGRALMRARACDAPAPGELLTRVNDLLCDDTLDSGRFITMFLLRLENGGLAPGGRLRWSRAGHDPALIYDPKTDAFTELMGAGIPLGVIQSWRYEDNGCEGLSPGMILAIGTDGIWEAHNPEEEMFGHGRFREILKRNAHRPAREIVDEVVAAVEVFHQGVARQDDITLVIIKALA